MRIMWEKGRKIKKEQRSKFSDPLIFWMAITSARQTTETFINFRRENIFVALIQFCGAHDDDDDDGCCITKRSNQETREYSLTFKGTYNCIDDLIFDWTGFNQTSTSVDNFSVTKLLNPNWSNRRWYFLLESKSILSEQTRKTQSPVNLPCQEITHQEL